MRLLRPRLLATGLAAAGLVGGGVVVLGSGAGEAAPTAHPSCQALRVTATGEDSLSTAYRVDLATGRATRLGTLAVQVDAIGYHHGQRLVYGVAGARLVSLTLDGALTDHGPVPGFDGASAGAVLGDRLLVRDGRHLRAIAVDPAAADFATVVGSTRLHPAELARTVDDFDARGGALYGVTTHVPYYGRVVSIDPATGSVSAVDGPRLPGGRSYGSAALGPDGALFAASNTTAEHDWHERDEPLRSRLTRLAPGPNAAAEEIAAWPAATRTDMTGCLGTTQPPIPTNPPTPPIPTNPPTTPSIPTNPPTTTPSIPTNPTTPRPTTTRPTTTRPIPTRPIPTNPPTTTRPRPRPTTPPPPPPPPPPPTQPADPPAADPPAAEPPAPPPPPPPAPPAPPVLAAGLPDRAPQLARPAVTPTEKKRRWGVATLALIIGAGAVAGASHRRRH
ncbi:DUF6923 family protein [Actinokineospora guangxiensis]|uniref:DUF6923 family protein n=1 Tax=Actinokineospora guangxiensis TaxID=1490288 RepID=A0ABW0ERS8_9PSEU